MILFVRGIKLGYLMGIALEIYREQLQLAWEDGKITEKERMMLKDLRLSLGISDKEHERLEKELNEAKVQ